jgi:hypothetical protein
MDSLIQRRENQGEGLGHTMEPSEAQEPERGKNLGSNSGMPQKAEGESDQLPVRHIAFWGKTVSLRFREWGRSTVLCGSV